jgi:uncharacterized protein YyaL (SSP411 family)
LLSNKLINEKSPYLLQHANNPVQWYPWGEEAFKKSKEENKPIFLSIGYSTCYWCHVMEREVFENKEIADLMNDSFVNIKVDREERPDIDRVYMTALQHILGGGGWPLNMFLTPDLKPFYGATYIPPKSKFGRSGIEDIIEEINNLWKNKQNEVLESGNKIIDYIAKKINIKDKSVFTIDDINELENRTFEQAKKSFDDEFGGFGSGNKFPRPVLPDFLLKYYNKTRNFEALDIVTFTLQKMYYGGMYDHLEGGFHRYSVDPYWRVPHFEKMLYDQAQLSLTYSEVYQITGKEIFLDISRDILIYVLNNLTDTEGGFYSAEDAESYPDHSGKSEKEEGAFYLWTKGEIEKILGKEDADIFNALYGVEHFGNTINDPHNVFGKKNVLYIANNLSDISKDAGKTEDEVINILEKSKNKLRDYRSARPRPHLDDKILTSWNGLMISAYAKMYQITGVVNYLSASVRCADFIIKKLYSESEHKLYHRYRDGEVKYDGTLEDYSNFINALLNLYEACFDSKYLKLSIELNKIAVDKFYDITSGGFFENSPETKDVILNIKEIYDGAEPSANSIQLINMLRIAVITQNDNYLEKVKNSLELFYNDISKLPFSSPLLLSAYDYYIYSIKEIIISGDGKNLLTQEFIKEIGKYYIPGKVVIRADDEIKGISSFIDSLIIDEQKPAVFVCENFKCNLPIYGIENLHKYFKENKINKEIEK